jgi:hypothetical protein
MTPGDWFNAATLIIALVALIVSIFAQQTTSAFNTRQLDFQATADRLNQLLIEREAKDDLEGKRADLSANLVALGERKHRLKVFNRGRGIARNVRLIDLGGDESVLWAEELAQTFPVLILDQHQSVTLCAEITFRSPRRAHIKLVWDDDTGNDHTLELTPAL